jgi:hypothetical protein
MNKESFLYVVIFTFIVAFVFVFIIALADGATAERVARNRELVTAQAFLNSIGKSEDDGLKALDEFNTIFKDVDAEGVNRAVVNGRDVIVKQFQGNGLWGTITGVLAVDSSLSQIIAWTSSVTPRPRASADVSKKTGLKTSSAEKKSDRVESRSEKVKAVWMKTRKTASSTASPVLLSPVTLWR